MAYDRFLIAPFNTGLQQNMRPWLIMDDAFSTMDNAYVFRGRVRKRFGAESMGVLGQLSSRLRVQVGTYGAPSVMVPGTQFNIGQMFSVGSDIFTVYQNGTMLFATPLPSTNVATGTFNTGTGAFTITYSSGAPINATPIFWYPALPVMGITQYQIGLLNTQPSYAFDTQFAYLYAGGAWARSGLAEWKGNNLNFFNICNWEGLNVGTVTMFVTNFNATVPNPAVTDDPIWYGSGSAPGFTVTWTAMLGSSANGIFFAPSPPNGSGVPTPLPRYKGPFVQTCRLIMAFKNRLLLLNTIENNNPNGTGLGGTNTQYVNRCRYSHNGSPLAQNAWYEQNQMDSSATGNNGALSIADGGGFIDAATEEQIVSAQFIKDRLIVFFERSTWEIAYTGNDKKPFVWQKINTELGSDAQNSSVPFDKEILTIGQTGVHACNGANTARIDEKIPDQIFNIKDKNLGAQRVFGIRDYYTETVYWSFPAAAPVGFDDISISPLFTYPSRILVYNYQNSSWAINDDCVTSFGYWQQDSDITWQSSAPLTWEEADFTWNAGELQQAFREIIAGNQEGFMFVVRPNIARNAPSLQITNLTYTSSLITISVIDATLDFGEFILIENVIGTGNMATLLNKTIFQVVNVNVPGNTITIRPQFPIVLTGVYAGAGTITRVSQINILSKQWNPYDKLGRNVSVSKVDFAVQNAGNPPIPLPPTYFPPQVTVDYFANSSTTSTISTAVPGTLMCNGILETGPYQYVERERQQQKLWHSLYLTSYGDCIQLWISLSAPQMYAPSCSLADFQLEGLILYCNPCDNRIT